MMRWPRTFDFLLVDVGVEDPVERLLGRRDVVAERGEDDDRRTDPLQIDGDAVRASSGARIGQPPRDRRPRLLERARAHEETDVSAGDQLLLDPPFRGSDEGLRRENLLAGRDVVALASEEI